MAEGADVPLAGVLAAAPPPSLCVAAVLGDALRRVSVLGGRDGMPRSLGSVYGGAVTRFLGGGLRGVESRVINMRGVRSWINGIAVSRDGSRLLVSDGVNVYSGRVAVFSASGRLALTMGDGCFGAVTMIGGTVVAQDRDLQQCVVFA